MANLGYIGLGVMGSRMVDRLMARGHTVIGHNRTKSKAQWPIDKGMAWGDSRHAVAEAADVVFVMVTDSAALASVTVGRGGLADDAVRWADDPEHARRGMVRLQDDAERRVGGARAGRSVKVPLPTTSVSNDYLTAGRAMGLEKKTSPPSSRC